MNSFQYRFLTESSAGNHASGLMPGTRFVVGFLLIILVISLLSLSKVICVSKRRSGERFHLVSVSPSPQVPEIVAVSREGISAVFTAESSSECRCVVGRSAGGGSGGPDVGMCEPTASASGVVPSSRGCCDGASPRPSFASGVSSKLSFARSS